MQGTNINQDRNSWIAASLLRSFKTAARKSELKEAAQKMKA